jgi:Zn-dependent metalloprotease
MTYTANHQMITNLNQATLLMQEADTTNANLEAQKVHAGAKQTYQLYLSAFGRDAPDGRGGPQNNVVNYGPPNFQNAFFASNGTQGAAMYGDGYTDVNVVAHEDTHGVTLATSHLMYQDESGAINEGHSDIFAAFNTYNSSGKVINTDTWKIGANVIPKPAAGAKRFMDNPTLDGHSRDYYPELYTGTQDHGGVHSNSGILNLAFVLLAQGGSHPRGKTNVPVQAIGMEAAIQIDYRAQTMYENATCNFACARTAWEQAATDLFGASSLQVNSVGGAFAAVGVGTTPPELPPDPTPTTPGTGGSPKDGSGGGNSGGCSTASQPASDIATLLFALALAVTGPGARRGRRSERRAATPARRPCSRSVIGRQQRT